MSDEHTEKEEWETLGELWTLFLSSSSSEHIPLSKEVRNERRTDGDGRRGCMNALTKRSFLFVFVFSLFQRQAGTLHHHHRRPSLIHRDTSSLGGGKKGVCV